MYTYIVHTYTHTIASYIFAANIRHHKEKSLKLLNKKGCGHIIIKVLSDIVNLDNFERFNILT